MTSKAIINNIECIIHSYMYGKNRNYDYILIYVLSSTFKEHVKHAKELQKIIGGEIIGNAYFYKYSPFNNGMNSSYQFEIEKGKFDLNLYLITE